MNTRTKLLFAKIAIFLAVSVPAFAHENDTEFNLSKYMDEIPGIGLISDDIKFDGITISDFKFENGKKYIVVNPNEEFSATMCYQIDASELKTLSYHHLIIGLYDDGPQKCIVESLGIRDSHGAVAVDLIAPEKTGAYQVRFCHSKGLTDAGAKEAWWKGEGPAAKTIVGIVIVTAK